MRGLESISDFVMVYIINPQWYSDKFYIKSRRYELYNFGYYLKEFHDVLLTLHGWPTFYLEPER